MWRTFDQVGPVELRGIAAARAAARERAWSAGAGPATDDLIIDFDATLINTKADKQDARPNYKRGYGHHPLLALIAETDEVLCAKLRPGNAGSNTAIDHLTVLADALDQLPGEWSAGHGVGDDPSKVAHRVLVRADAGGASHWFAEECVDRNLDYSFGCHIDHRVRDGVMCVPTGCWHPAIDTNGAHRDGAEVVELTEFVDLSNWPDGTRLIVRRERPHPGAQLSLFDTIEGFRHTAFITTQSSADIAGLELQQRQRARAENVIRATKACGLTNLPFDDVVNNEGWMNCASQPTTCSAGPAAPGNSDEPPRKPSATGCSTSPHGSHRTAAGSASITTGPGPKSSSTPSTESAPHSSHSPSPEPSPLKQPYERSGLGPLVFGRGSARFAR